jgi:predicted transcriptional regulator
MSKPASFTERELDIMSVLWSRGSGTVAEVRENLKDELGYTSVLKMLQILEEKGAIRHETEGRAYRYFPLVEQEEAGGHALSRIVNKIFQGSTELALAHLVSDRSLTPRQIGKMRRLLDEAAEEAAGSHGEPGVSDEPAKEEGP